MYRARYLALVVVGESHPEVALIDSNIGLILHAVGEYEPSLKFLEKALELNIRFHGSKSLKVAVSYHLVARTQSCMGDFRSALQNERETFAIYKSQLGDEHDKTKVKFLKFTRFICARAQSYRFFEKKLSNDRLSVSLAK